MDANRRLLLKGLLAMSSSAMLAACGGGGSSASASASSASASAPAGPSSLPPVTADDIADAVSPLLRVRAARLADYATFGANEDTVNQILLHGWENWVEMQLAMTPLTLYPTAAMVSPDPERPTRLQFDKAWWTHALNGEDQLNQRIAFALSQWFVISSQHPFLSSRHWSVLNYYDLLLQGVDDNFDELLYKVSVHPAMSAYLSSLFNMKADPALNRSPDENYAREVMQLFSVGAEKRYANGKFALDSNGDHIPNYTEEDVKELARVFTGIKLEGTNNFFDKAGDWTAPVAEYSANRDYDSKTIFGQTIPAGLNLHEDIRAAIAILMSKQDSLAGNFCRFMIQRLTVSNPRMSYVQDVSNAFINSGWNIKAMVKAILLHADAVDGRSDNQSETGRLKEPLLWYSTARRAIAPARDKDLAPNSTKVFNENGELDTDKSVGQTPLNAPNVFGFFPWDYQPGAIKGEGTAYIDYVAPESYMYDFNNIVLITNRIYNRIVKNDADIKVFKDQADSAISDEELTEFVLDRLLFGNHRQALKDEMIDLIGKQSNARNKTRAAIMLAISSPDFLIINMPQEV